ncbi:uncharacterized protein LOC133198476 [Saccostrea echinata]|uniref:uncharacterized protein LOC133198476 n=1 Tax=Saccostrea echinata TaxID=191078 RepID=UPI002A82C14E|nr:uncharacterized protein LOC133198476 [Saccostrea echinata]
MVMKLVVLGHSFVSRLEDFVNSSPDNRVTKNLNLSLEEIHVSYAGFRGATLSKVRAQGLRYVRLFHPDVVVLQVVSNDLCDPTKSVSDVFKQLIDFVISLRYAESVKHVVILQTLQRRPPSYRIRYEVDTQWFNERVDELKMRISSYLCNVEGSKFFRLSGFWSSASQDMVFSQDGMSEPKSAKRQPRGRRTQVIPAAAGSAEQAAQQTVQQTAQDQLVAAVTDKVLEAIRNESNQESQQMVETEDRGRKKHREPKKKRKRISSPPRSPSIAGREIQGISTLHGQVPSQHPSGVPTHLVNSTSKLLDAAMSKNTQVSYEVALNAYHKFFRANFSTSPTFPSQLNHIMSFIAWLYQHKKILQHNKYLCCRYFLLSQNTWSL